jgi:hypothetical protein
LPFLGPALIRLLEELPAPRDGLSGTERRVLQAIAAGATRPLGVFRATQDLEEAPFLGDMWFYRTLALLGAGDARLVETQEGEPLQAVTADPAPSLRLTRTGERVLARKEDRVTLLGADRWVGGTHVTPANLWRWDPTARQLIAPA